MTSPLTLDICAFEVQDQSALIALWEKAGLVRSWNDPAADIAFAMGGENATILIGKCAGQLVASVMVGHDGHRGMVYYMAVDPEAQNRGFGRQMMQAAEGWLISHGVVKLNLLIRPENAEVQRFYEALGYEVEPRLCMARRLIPLSS